MIECNRRKQEITHSVYLKVKEGYSDGRREKVGGRVV